MIALTLAFTRSSSLLLSSVAVAELLVAVVARLGVEIRGVGFTLGKQVVALRIGFEELLDHTEDLVTVALLELLDDLGSELVDVAVD